MTSTLVRADERPRSGRELAGPLGLLDIAYLHRNFNRFSRNAFGDSRIILFDNDMVVVLRWRMLIASKQGPALEGVRLGYKRSGQMIHGSEVHSLPNGRFQAFAVAGGPDWMFVHVNCGAHGLFGIEIAVAFESVRDFDTVTIKDNGVTIEYDEGGPSLFVGRLGV